jgi:hypothetical protein
MASSNKRKTTIAKHNRERKLAERRIEKQARKEARRASAREPEPPTDPLTSTTPESAGPLLGDPI